MASESQDAAEPVARAALRHDAFELACPGSRAGIDSSMEPGARFGWKPGAELGQLVLGESVHACRRRRELDCVASHRREVQLTPGDELRVRPSREDAQAEAAKERRGTYIYADDPKLPLLRGELHVRDPSQPATADVEDLAVEDVAAEEELVASDLVLRRVGSDHDLIHERRDGRPRDAAATAAPDAHAQRHDPWIVGAELDDQIVELPDPSAVDSAYRSPELVGEHRVTLVRLKSTDLCLATTTASPGRESGLHLAFSPS